MTASDANRQAVLDEWLATRCRLMPGRHGVGVFAIREIARGEEPLPADRSGPRWVKLPKSDYDERSRMPEVVSRMIRDYYVEDDDGVWVLTRERGMIDPVLFVNGGHPAEANVEWIDHEGGSRLVATRHIEAGEELLLDYADIGKSLPLP